MPAMFNLPPLPAWDAIHPIIVHFPIALLAVAPLFVLLALFPRPWGRAFALAAMVLIVLGTSGTWLAVASGEETEHSITIPEASDPIVHEHEEQGELARNLFTGLAAVFAVWTLIIATFVKKPRMGIIDRVFLVIYLLLHLAALTVLLNAASIGGRLVHVHGLHAPM